MSEQRKSVYGLQLQHGPAGSKMARIEVYPARLWWFRPSFRDLYPNEVWDWLFRVRVNGRWWWLKNRVGGRYPFYTHGEAWRMISAYAATQVGICAQLEPVVVPSLSKGDEVIAHVDGLRTKAQIKEAPWVDEGVCWVGVVGVPTPVPVNMVWQP